MAQPNFINFASPEQQAQQAELERRQQLADYLRKESMTPLESQSVSNPNGGSIAVKTNPWAGLAKLGQAYFAGQSQNDIAEQRLELAKAVREGRMGDMERIATAASGTPAIPGTPEQAGQPIASQDNPQGAVYTDDQTAVPASDQQGYNTMSTPATAGTPAVPPMSGKDLARVMMSSPYEDRQQMGERMMFSKPETHVLPEGASLVDDSGKSIASGAPKRIPPMVEHNFSVGGDMVQPHVSLDNGVTWNPIPGSEKSHKFAKQVAPVVNVGGSDPEPLTALGQKVADDLIANNKPLPGGWGKNGISRGNAALNRLGASIYAEGGSGIPLSQQQNEGAAAKTAETKFTSGPQADTIRALGTANRHADLAGQLLDLQQNGQMQVPNAIRAAFRAQFGSELPTNTKLALDVLGKEVVKSLGVAGAGTAEERNAISKGMQMNGSPEQQRGAIHTARALMGGQVQGFAQQYEAATKKKDFYTRFGFTPQGNVATQGAASGGWGQAEVVK